MEDNKCAGPLTISSPTTSSWYTKPLPSMNTRSTVLCPPPRQASPSPQVRPRMARLGSLRFQDCHPRYPTRLDIRAQLRPVRPRRRPSIQAPSLIFYGSPVCSLRERNPSGCRLVLGLRLLTSRWTLTSTFWCLLSTRQPRESASFYARCTWRNRTNAYLWCKLTLAVWGGAVVLRVVVVSTLCPT